MEDNTQEQRIEYDAERYINDPDIFQLTPMSIARSCYIAGATKEAERARELVRALDLAYAYLHSGISINPHSGIYNTIEKALQDYNKK